MTTRRFDFDPADVDTDGIADALPTGTDWSFAATALWLLDSAQDGLAHRLGITTYANEPGGNAPSMTLTGTDADDNAITDVVVLPATTLVETVKYFKTVTSATTGSNATVGTIDIGWVDEFVSPTIFIDEQFQSNWQIDVTGTLNLDSDWLLKDIRYGTKLSDQNTEPWIDGAVTDLDAETADSSAAIAVPEGYVAMRFRMNTYSSGAEFQAYCSQRSPGPFSDQVRARTVTGVDKRVIGGHDA